MRFRRSVSRAGSCGRSGASPRRSVVVRVRRRAGANQRWLLPGCRFEQHWLLIDDTLADVESDYTDVPLHHIPTSVAVLLLLLINAYQAFDEFFSLLDNSSFARRCWSTCQQ